MMQSLVKFRNRKKGFTLVELIVVIAIIGILAAIMMPKFFGFTDDAKKNAVMSEAKNIRTIAETYYAQNGAWPQASGTSGFQVQTGWSTDATPVATYTNSPTFAGTLAVSGSVASPIKIDGSFKYTIGTHTTEIDKDGKLTAN